ncbi:protein phosphatase 2C domain-containing protein [Niveibacterium sp. SC-1]|uniref:PP2C family protein-serine/threonine phosphatase n=1 Tax=Niveibacterium sp. SC-1 TaxID=3135646 RepID=UPI00311D32B2
MIKLQAVMHTDRGGRSHNDDVVAMRIREGDACFVVCDGVGANQGGGTAAGIAARETLRVFEARGNEEFTQLPLRSLEAIQTRLRVAQDAAPECAAMATTWVGLFLDRGSAVAHWDHAGDSRLYHFRHGVLQARTRDHSLVAQLEAAGLPTAGLSRSLLVHALGLSRYEGEPARLPIQDGDAFLLCTDGFWQRLDEQTLEAQLQVSGSVEEWMTVICAQAGQNLDGPADNQSAIAVWIGDPQDATLARPRQASAFR